MTDSPHQLLGRYDTNGEVISACASSEDDCIVEVARYAFLTIKDFNGLFGPLQATPARRAD